MSARKLTLKALLAVLSLGLLAAPAASGCGGAEEPGSRPASVASVTSAQAASTPPASSSTKSQAPARTKPGTTGAQTSTTSAKEAPSSTGPVKFLGSGVTAQANTICIRRNRELDKDSLAGTSLPAIASAAARRAAIEQRALSELHALKPPANVAKAWKKVLLDSEVTLAEVVKLGKYASANDAAGVRRQSASSKAPQVRLLVAGAHAGLRHCSSVG